MFAASAASARGDATRRHGLVCAREPHSWSAGLHASGYPTRAPTDCSRPGPHGKAAMSGSDGERYAEVSATRRQTNAAGLRPVVGLRSVSAIRTAAIARERQRVAAAESKAAAAPAAAAPAAAAPAAAAGVERGCRLCRRWDSGFTGEEPASPPTNVRGERRLVPVADVSSPVRFRLACASSRL